MKSHTLAQDLRQLSADPKAHAEKAISYLNRKKRRDVQLAALKALLELPSIEAHQPLLDLYNYYAKNGPKRDAGAYMRRAILDALRPIATPEDVPLLLEAVDTFEFLPPSFNEDANLLRSGALLTLNDLDDEPASYHAARLLVNEYTEAMSGEPALTAARVLHSQGQYLPIFHFIMNPNADLPDVISEGLRCLTTLPVEMIPVLIARHGESQQAAVRVGLYDLLIKHDCGPQALDFLAGVLISESDLDVFRYLAIALLSSRRPGLLSLVNQAISLEGNTNRLAILLETAELFAGDPDVDALAAKLREKVSA